MTWTAIITALEGATGPGLKIDVMIAEECGWVRGHVGNEPCWYDSLRDMKAACTAMLLHIEQINIHCGANTFQIFPEVGPNKVSCHFPPKMYDDAVSAVGRRVEVFVTLRYRAGASFAHQIAVSSIETHPFEHDIPDWDDLRGRSPDATGLVSSEAFIRELRDAW